MQFQTEAVRLWTVLRGGINDFFLTLTFYDSYDSRPPSETATKNDYGFTTGLSWSFRR